MIILKVTKKHDFTLSLKIIYLEKVLGVKLLLVGLFRVN